MTFLSAVTLIVLQASVQSIIDDYETGNVKSVFTCKDNSV